MMQRRDVLAASAALPWAGTARLSLNENPFGPSPKVAAAILAALPYLARYADQADADRLAMRIAAYEGVGADQVILGDVLEPLGRALALAGGPGARLVYSDPGYTALIDAARPLGAQGVPVPLDQALRDDLPALATAADAHATALFLVHPHNPSGTAHDPAAALAFVRAVAERTLVIADEAYLDYAPDPRASLATLTRAGANVAVFRTFDKIHGLAALPFGYALVPRDLATRLRAAGVGAAHGLGRLALVAAEASLDDPEWVAQVRRRTIAGRERLHAALDALGLERSASQADFVFFKSPVAAAGLRERLAAGGIQVGRAFPPLDQWVRVTVGTEDEVGRTITALIAALE